MKTLFKDYRLMIIIAAFATACGTEQVNDLRQYSEAVASQEDQRQSPSSGQNQQPSSDQNQQQLPDPTGSGETPESQVPDSTPTGGGDPGQDRPGDPPSDSPGDSPEPEETPKVDPTAGDNVQSLRFKTTCYQAGNGSCFLHQSTSRNAGFYENLCRQGSRDAKISKGENACAALEITAKCSVNFRGDKLIFYNIGELTAEKDRELSETCAGTEVLGQVIRGTYVRFAEPSP